MMTLGKQNGFAAGVALTEITPDRPIAMGGYGQRAGLLSKGVHDALFAKALYLTDGETRLLFITTDLISIPDQIYARVLSRLVGAGVIEEAGLCLSASHTHSGPDVEESLIIASPTREYLDSLVEKLIQAGTEAAASPVPVKLKTAVGTAGFLANRRAMETRPLVDPRVLAIELDETLSGKPLAVLFGAGCHAVCLGHDNLQISADYPGSAQRYVENELGCSSALFINMTEGNIIPSTRPKYDSLDTRGYLGGTFEEAQQVGAELGSEVVRILGRADPVRSTRLRTVKRIVMVNPAYSKLSYWKAWKQLLIERRIILEYLPGFKKASPFILKPVYTLWRDASAVVIERNMDEVEMRRLMSAVSRFLMMAMKLANPAFRKPYPLRIQVIEIDDFRFLALPGEVLVEVGKDWQTRNAPNEEKAFIFGLSNGFVGYLPHPENFKEPGAEYKYETIMNALEPGATGIALDFAEKMITKQGA
jgi:hypothetical protein